jgi:hypothetical protein
LDLTEKGSREGEGEKTMPWQKNETLFPIDHPVKSRLIERRHLENGLTLEMYDNSRPVAGDRWLVSFEARIEVEVREKYFRNQHKADVSFEVIQNITGDRVVYRYKSERNFISENEKDGVLSETKERFLNTNLGYLSNPDFPLGLILRKYNEALHKKR